jgi:SAM-dependent methyltransferase
MTWRQKAFLQNVIAELPSDLSYKLHYFLRRRFGGLRATGPTMLLKAGVTMVDMLRDQGRSVESSAVLEIGTGCQINLAIAFWLCGASKVTTIDLNPYLSEDLVARDVAYIREHQEEIHAIFGEYVRNPLFRDRLDRLISHRGGVDDLLAMTNIHYLAPADARSLALEADSIDYYVSNAVLQHIPVAILNGIVREARRLLKPDGLFVHWIDMGDHFAHIDRSISPVNFLQFSEPQWNQLAGNRYMFQNRLRIDDYENILEHAGAEILKLTPSVNKEAEKVLQQGLPLDPQFAGKNAMTNATTSAWVIGRYDGKPASERTEDSEEGHKLISILIAVQSLLDCVFPGLLDSLYPIFECV